MAPRSTTPGVTTRRSATGLTPPFGDYPYLVTRIGRCALRHVAVLPATWSRERLVGLVRRQAAANRLDTCLALGTGDAVYVNADGTESEETYVPTGLPVVDRLHLAEALPRTAAMAVRRARLLAQADAHRGSGYIVGDGLEAGRPARPDHILRLGEPLAEHRLSAYHFLEETGSVCYVAAYCAFSHRCPTDARRAAR